MDLTTHKERWIGAALSDGRRPTTLCDIKQSKCGDVYLSGTDYSLSIARPWLVVGDPEIDEQLTIRAWGGTITITRTG